MSAAAGILLSINGVDKTSAAFASVQKRAQAAMGGVRKALAFAGVGLGLAAVTRSAYRATAALGELSDQSQRMSSSAEDVQRLTGALDKVGVVGVNVDSLAAAFGRMAKETGRVGVAGFKAQLESVAKLGDEQARVTELTRVFGREMGAKFAPLVRQGPDALREGLAGVMAMMPAVSTAAANAGDSAADALKLAGLEMKTAWQQTIGDMVAGWQGTFGVSFEESIYAAVEWVKWGAKAIWGTFRAVAENLGQLARLWVSDWRGGLDWLGRGFAGVLLGIGKLAREFGSQLWGWLTGGGAMDWKAVWQSAVDGFESVGKSTFGGGVEWSVVDTDALAAARDAAIEIKRAGIEAQAKLASGGALADAGVEEAGKKAAAKVKQAAREANKLVFAGSYDAMKLAMGGGAAGGFGRAAGSSGGFAAGGSGAGGASGGGDSQVARLLRELIQIQRTGWRDFAKIGAV